MTNYKLIILIIAMLFTSFASGYVMHEAQDKVEIIQEAQKIIIEKHTFNISKLNISICGEDLNYGR